MLLSIITVIPSDYDETKLSFFLEKRKVQNIPEVESIFIDTSERNSVEGVVKSFIPDAKVYRMVPEYVTDEAFFFGILKAHADYVSLLYPDSCFLPEVLESVLPVIREKGNQTDIFHGGYSVKEKPIFPMGWPFDFYGANLFFQSTLIRRSFFECCYGFRFRFKMAASLDFFLMAKEQGARTASLGIAMIQCQEQKLSRRQKRLKNRECRKVLLLHGFPSIFANFVFLAQKIVPSLFP